MPSPRTHYSQSRWELAADEFARFLSDYPDHARADAVLFYWAESLVQGQRYPAAHERFAEYVQRHPGGKYQVQALFRLGETLYLDGQHLRAEEHLDRFVQSHAEHDLCAYAYPYLGEIRLEAGEPARAREAFEQGLQRFPSGPMANECRFGLARALEALGESESAIRFYGFLGDGEERTALGDHALLQMAILLYRQQRYAEAITALDRHRQYYPGSDRAAHARLLVGTQPDRCQRSPSGRRASRGLPPGVSTSTDVAPAMAFNAAEAYCGLQELPKALEYYEQVLSEYPDGEWAAKSLQRLVELAWQQQDCARVRELAGRFAERYPSSPLLVRVQHTAARACLKQGAHGEAVALLEPLLKLRDQDEEDGLFASDELTAAPEPADIVGREPAHLSATRYYLALARLGDKQFAQALEQLDLLAGATGPPEWLSGIQAARATALLGLERHEQALEALDACLGLQPDAADSDHYRAQLLVTCARLNRWSQVDSVLTQLQSRTGDSELYLSSVAYVAEAAYRQGQHELAGRAFRELAREGNPAAYVAQGLSGLAWLAWDRDGGCAESAGHFEQLLDRFPDSPLAAEAAMMRGQALEKMDNPEGALAMYLLVTQRYADSPHAGGALLAAAKIHDALQQDREAEPLLRRWLDQHPISPDRPTALYQLAWVLADLDRREDADEVFQQIHEQYPTSRYWSDATYRLAERAARAENFPRADALAREISERTEEPQVIAYALYLQVQLAAADQRWTDVLETSRRLLREYPESTHRLPAQYWLAEANYRLRQYRQAGQLFDQLDAQTRDRTDAWVAMIPLRRRPGASP